MPTYIFNYPRVWDYDTSDYFLFQQQMTYYPFVMTCPPLPTPLPQGARESFLVLKACHYEETSRAEYKIAYTE